MKALEFRTKINPDFTVSLPPEIAAQTRQAQPVRVILLIPESNEDIDWAQLTVEQFAQGYSDGDDIYNDL
ncbi:MAG: hypothetical protein BZY88_07575 [SAR202 cluster bacterium Io17-Chloro-G9]|nr:MAG: hypothetical protein BZY88_07575 [SAR202 cluster bacterium Io17-Chloro-G9]